jgi:two-component system response regulator HydG
MRSDKPFVKVSCAALPETLLEAELFGHERGAFTGAIIRREGRFEIANGGTLFLDEIGEMSIATQVKLLRVLQEGEFERLGSSKTIKVDVRLIAATNVDLLSAIKEKKFREDLYYRLNVITITLPPLRDRRDDIPLLAEHFLSIYREKNHKSIKGISKEALDILSAYSWPGNVRELENTIERAVVLARGDLITSEELPETIRGTSQNNNYLMIPVGTPLEEIELKVIQETLKQVKGDKNLAAKLLGIASRTIYRKLDDLEKMVLAPEHKNDAFVEEP